MRQADRQTALALLRKSLGDPRAEFRADQWECIDNLVNHRRSLVVVQRTGWGKSTVYFIASRILRGRGAGPTLIVSPLLALMRNQATSAERLGIRAETVNSSNTEQWQEIRRALEKDQVDVLLISPERLANEEFLRDFLVPAIRRVGLLVIDEIHCISDWGHDFRPDYKRIKNLLQFMEDELVLGTTATANDRVVRDIKSQFRDIPVVRGPLMRETIALQNMRLPSKTERLAWLAEHIGELRGTGIIYTLTKHDAEKVAEWLRANGVDALAYYSDVKSEDFPDSPSYRLELEDSLMRNEIKALVATSALGMGYDKPDLGFVVHYQVPGSVVAYYQQVGRAGRAIDAAHGIVMSGEEDGDIVSFFRRTAFPEESLVERILDALEESLDGLTIPGIEEKINLRRSQIQKVLKFLSTEEPRSPVIQGEDRKWRRTPVKYALDHEKIERITNQREAEWEEIQRYVDEKGCLMTFLAESLNQQGVKPCGRCANCIGQPVVGLCVSNGAKQRAARFLRRSETPIEPRKTFVRNGFPEYGFKGKISPDLRHEEGRIMSRWGEPVVGKWISEDRHGHRYRDEIVDAAAEMVESRWRPDPEPEWVTCVASRNSSGSLADFSRRLARKLGVAFLPAVIRARNNGSQREQGNSFHQCRNLDGVFGIRRPVNPGAVLLVDDVCDSRWTLTVVAALLRKAGSGPVFPLALASAIGG